MTKTTAFTEAVRFTADSLMPAGVVSKETRALMQEYAFTRFDTDEAKEAFRAKIVDSLSEPAKKALASVGATLPTDAINVSLEFGSFLYDLYDLGSVRPVAPLAVAAHTRRLQDLASRLEKDEISLKPEELAVIKKVLEDDEVWKNAKFNCYVEVEGERGKEKRALTLTTQGIQFYNKTLNAVVKLFEAPENEARAPEQAVDGAQGSTVQVS